MAIPSHARADAGKHAIGGQDVGRQDVGKQGAAARFAVVAAARSGSNYLCTLLDSHPDVVCHHEVFNPDGIFYALDHRGVLELGTLAVRDADPLGFLDRLWSATPEARVIGLKFTEGQSPVAFDHVLDDADVKKVLLVRRNRVCAWVSRRLAERRALWELYVPAPPPRPLALALDAADLRRHAVAAASFLEDVAARARGPVLSVGYEDLGTDLTQRRLQEFLGVSFAPLLARSVKQNPLDLRRSITNFDEIAEALDGDPLLEELLAIDP